MRRQCLFVLLSGLAVAPLALRGAAVSPETLTALRGLEVRDAGPYRLAPARCDSLWAYFQDANPELVAHLAQLKRAQAQGRPHRGLTAVAAAAGVGKSYVIHQLELPETATVGPLKLTQLLDERAPDLQTTDGVRVFNRLPASPDLCLDDLLDAAGAAGRAFILIDELDEIHPRTARALLTQLEGWLAARPEGFIEALVFGRPEAFRPWLAEVPPRAGVQRRVLSLVGPRLATSGDVAFRCRDYIRFRYRHEASDPLLATLDTIAQSAPAFRATLRPLAPGNALIDTLLEFPAPGDHRPPAVETQLFTRLLERNHNSHGRPQADDTVYVELLQRAAAFPFDHDRPLDARGFFAVRAGDLLVSRDGHAVRLRDLLERSGLALVDITRPASTWIRFEPLWLQRHLLER